MCMGEAGENISDPPHAPRISIFSWTPRPPYFDFCMDPPTLISTCYMGNKWTSYYVNLRAFHLETLHFVEIHSKTSLHLHVPCGEQHLILKLGVFICSKEEYFSFSQMLWYRVIQLFVTLAGPRQ